MDLVSPSAAEVVARALPNGCRLLVLGAGGWFGRTAIDLARQAGAEILPIASTARSVIAGGAPIATHVWDPEAVQRFEPEVVIDCAFLTRDRVSGMSLTEYVEINRRLMAQAMQARSIESVRSFVTISSGAAVHPTDAAMNPIEANPYGFLKREVELTLEAQSESRLRDVVARAWSVSGAYVGHPRNYALADMILQAHVDGRISIRADHAVRRRYVLADELLAIALSAGQPGNLTIVDSGGPLVEIQELADVIRQVVRPDASVSRPDIGGSHPDDYFSDGTAWQGLATVVRLECLDLAGQVEVTARGLLGSNDTINERR